MGLRSFGQGDLEAESLDLPDVVAELAGDIGAGLVVAVAEVGVAGFGVTEQVPVALWGPSPCGDLRCVRDVRQILGECQQARPGDRPGLLR